MENCISSIRNWMVAHKLKLNESKTEFIMLGTPLMLSKMNINSISIGSNNIPPSSKVRNLGVIFDSNMKYEEHVKKICRTGNYYLYNLRKIRKHMSQDTMHKLVRAFIHSHIDYCNSVLYNIPDYLIKRLQRILNNAAKLVRNSYDIPSQNALCSLHWLPVNLRIEYKLLVLVFKALHNQCPTYLSQHIIPVHNTRYSMRSNNSLNLAIPRTKRKTLGDRSFHYSGPFLWNKLPPSIRSASTLDSFTTKLKTYFFRLAFM